jgi:AcrR family transcriptional regulator
MRPRIVDEADLLDLMLEAFADLGYDGTSVRSLCRHLNVSHNLIHRRYESKEAAWTAAIDHAFARLTETVFAPAADQATDDGAVDIEQVRAMMRRWVDATISQPALARIIHQECARPGPRFDYMFSAYILPIQEQAREALERGQAAGFIRPGPVSAAFFFLNTWGVGGIASSQPVADVVGSKGDDARASAYLAVDIVLDGLAAR